MALTLRRRPTMQLRLHDLSNMAPQARVPTVVTNDVLFHDSVAAHPAGCRHLHPAQRHHRRCRLSARAPCRPLSEAAGEMGRLFAATPTRSPARVEIADRCRFSLDELAYQYPEERMRRA
jgi:error-prone DNA polymerase